MIVGGESGGGPEYLWDSTKDWREEFNTPGRRTMRLEWAQSLFGKSRAAGIPFFFKQVTAFRSGTGENAFGQLHQEFPSPPHSVWAEAKNLNQARVHLRVFEGGAVVHLTLAHL
ncbi:MAG TPA: hypothetical protein VIH78_08725 [Terriglobales bacterium]